jgi:hypothetical protein
MIKFNKPTNLNGAELRKELNDVGVTISNDLNSVTIDADGNLWLDIANKDEAKATSIVEAHNGTMVAPELTVEQKLASVGLNLGDLKTALGL